MSTYNLRQRLIDIARFDVGKTEETKNQAPWIRKLWPATSYGSQGFNDRAPYCAAAMCYWVQQWLRDEEVRKAIGLTVEQAEKWRCKAAAVINWIEWAKETKGVTILPKTCILHAGDIVVYRWENGSRHIELVSNDDNTETGPLVAIGANTSPALSREGEGAFEKPRSRTYVECVLRILQ